MPNQKQIKKQKIPMKRATAINNRFSEMNIICTFNLSQVD